MLNDSDKLLSGTEREGSFPTIIVTTVSILGLILLLLILFFLFKRQQTKEATVAKTPTKEMNPVYGDYYVDPEPTVEVKDTNAYYSSEYESGTSRTTDNNTYYEM